MTIIIIITTIGILPNWKTRRSGDILIRQNTSGKSSVFRNNFREELVKPVSGVGWLSAPSISSLLFSSLFLLFSSLLYFFGISHFVWQTLFSLLFSLFSLLSSLLSSLLPSSLLPSSLLPSSLLVFGFSV